MRKDIISTFSLIIIVKENMTNKNMILCVYLVMGFLPYDLYFDIACRGCNGYSACLHCLCSDFFNFLWPFKTFKISNL